MACWPRRPGAASTSAHEEGGAGAGNGALEAEDFVVVLTGLSAADAAQLATTLHRTVGELAIAHPSGDNPARTLGHDRRSKAGKRCGLSPYLLSPQE